MSNRLVFLILKLNKTLLKLFLGFKLAFNKFGIRADNILYLLL